MEIILQEASPEDAALISEMAARIWKDHYIPIIGAEQVKYMLDKMYKPEAIVKQMEEGQVFRLAFTDKEPIGYIAISSKGEGSYFLHKFYIETGGQGKGAGKMIIEQAIALYPDMREMRLTVNRQNYKSVNFYFKMGFKIEEVADFDIGNGYFMNDFVMLKKV